mgnify:CR=1 FL=1
MEDCYIYFAYDWLVIRYNQKELAKWCMEHYKMTETEAKREARLSLKVKIGETYDLRQRDNQLRYKEGISIEKTFKFIGTHADRLFIEAYIRSKIERHYGNLAKKIGNDHFYCYNQNIVKAINNKFMTWAQEGYDLLMALG